MIVKCDRCHHEWQQHREDPTTCDWCGSVDSTVLDTGKDGLIDLAELMFGPER